MKGDDQMKFVQNTERDCELLSTTGTMAWEWFYSWENAVETYFPLYSEKNSVKGFFAINVPYPLPIIAFKGHYKVIGGNSVLFKPFADWQKTDGSGSPLPFPDPFDNMLPEQMAKRLSALEKGTVTYVYMTHDAGARIKDITQVVGNLSSHVEVVNQNVLVEMAIQREKHIELDFTI